MAGEFLHIGLLRWQPSGYGSSKQGSTKIRTFLYKERNVKRSEIGSGYQE